VVYVNKPAGYTGQNTADVTSDYLCTSPSFTIIANDEKTNLALTESNNIFHEANTNGGWRTWTQGTAITTMTPGKAYEFIPGISTTDFTDNAYGQAFTISAVPACGSLQVNVYNDATTFTGTYLNQNGAAAGLTFASATDGTVSVKMQAAAKTVFGNPYLAGDNDQVDLGTHRRLYPNCACIQANDTVFDTVDVSSSVNGVSMNRIPVPGILTAATGDISYCFESPVVTQIVQEQYFGMDVATVAGGALDDFAIKFYPGGYYLDSNGIRRWGCETDSNAAVGASVVSVTGDVTA
jgi:hypothetical protein